MYRLAVLLAVVAAGAAALVVVLADGGEDQREITEREATERAVTARDVERRLLDELSESRPRSVACRRSSRRGYFDCKIWFRSMSDKQDGLGSVHGYDIEVPAKESEQKITAQWFSEHVSAWGSAATSYNHVLQQCARQPRPTRGYLAACTREYRKKYKRVAARLVRIALGARLVRRSCRRALEWAVNLSQQVTAGLARVFRTTQRRLDASVSDRPSPGSGVTFAILGRAGRITKRNVGLADHMHAELRRSCAGR